MPAIPDPTPGAERRPSRRRWRGATRRLAAIALLAATALPLAGVSALASPGPAPASSAPSAAPEPASPAGTSPVVVVGMTGVRWDDVQAVQTPALWDLAMSGSVSNLVVRSVRPSACPVDGWLTLGAGKRAADLAPASYGECRTPLEPADDGVVPGWADYQAAAAASAYGARLGLLGQTAQDAGLRVHSLGPGAAIAVADADGHPVGEHDVAFLDPTRLATSVRQAVASSDLLVVDLGMVRDTGRGTVAVGSGTAPQDEGPSGDGIDDEWLGSLLGDHPSWPDEQSALTEPSRTEQVGVIDDRLAAVLDAVQTTTPDATVFVVSLADSGTRVRMQLAAATGPGLGDSLLGSMSTRQDGIVQTTDLLPTLLDLLGLTDAVAPGDLVGSPVRAVGTRQTELSAAVARLASLVDADRHAVATQAYLSRFSTVLIIVNLALFAVVAVGLGRHTVRRPAAMLRSVRVAGVAVGALPVATFLSNLVPWWRAGSTGWALLATLAVIVAVITAVALAPPWGRTLLGSLGVVAAVTLVTLTADVLTGSTLQLSSLLGVQPVVGGRFYGMNNSAFALLTVAGLLTMTAVADPMVRRGRRWLPAALIAGVGAVLAVIDGMPGLGSDFGGPPAIIPAFALLALTAARIRLSWGRVLAVLLGAVVAVTGFAVIDWLRPQAERTHLGRFVQTVLDGGLWDVIWRKLGQNLTILTSSWLVLLAVGGILLVVVVLARPQRWSANRDSGWLVGQAPLSSLTAHAPLLRPGMFAIAVALGIGFAVNDSGIVIPAIGVSLAVPLLVATAATWLLHQGSWLTPRRDPAADVR